MKDWIDITNRIIDAFWISLAVISVALAIWSFTPHFNRKVDAVFSQQAKEGK